MEEDALDECASCPLGRSGAEGAFSGFGGVRTRDWSCSLARSGAGDALLSLNSSASFC